MSSLWPVGPSHPTHEENNDSNKKGTKVTAQITIPKFLRVNYHL